MYVLHREQILNTTPADAWNFIKNPQNLNLITPDDMQFNIITPLPEEMYDGLMIEYRVKLPVLGMQSWVSEIKHIRPLTAFVDEQRIGPYKLWYHYHKIEKVDNGVKMIDRVMYSLPFSFVGQMAHTLFVKKRLEEIFNYREKKLEEIFR